MLVLLIVSCLALVMTYYASKDELPYGLEMAFMLITFIAAIHYNYGNDYIQYKFLFETFQIYNFNWDYIIQKKYYKEPGWFVLNYLFHYLNFFYLVAFLSIAQNLIYYKLVKVYTPKKWWVMGLFIYLFSNSLYILNMSMMRQGFTVSLFVLSWMLVNRNKKLLPLSVVIVLIASTIHNSAIVLMPFLFISYINKKTSLYFAFFLLSLFLILYIKKDFINIILYQFCNFEDLDRLLNKYDDTSHSMTYGLGFLFIMFPFGALLYALINNKKYSDIEIKFISIATVSYIILPFREIIPMISRMSYYFTAFSIPSIPLVYRKFSYPYQIFFISSFIILYLYEYVSFFLASCYTDSYMDFHSIFEIIF